AAACEHFTTVLAPGSNRFHYDHIHVDLMRRSSGVRICNPEATSGAEVAARAARQGRSLAQQRQDEYERQSDPYAWRGGSRGREVGPTGSVRAQAQQRSSKSRLEYVDDEEALID
ncbi:MAG TPA: extensin family protein, partial [Xanthobacteraceae bacterium]|nr:extensin family protein [Xanthobacteraceae bacterium]